MATLPDETALGQRPTPRPASSVASYRATTGFEDATAQGLSAAGSELGKAAEIFSVYLRQQDETSASDAYTQKFSPAFREEYTKYRALQGRDAVDQLNPAIQKMQEIRTTVRDSLPTATQKKIFDSLATRRVEMELDIAAQHANTQNKVWQIGVERSTQQNNLSLAAEGDGTMADFENRVSLGVDDVIKYVNANGGLGIHGLTARGEAERFESEALVGRIGNLAITNPIQAQRELLGYKDAEGRDVPGVIGRIDPKQRKVLLNKVRESAGIVEAKADAVGAIAEVRTDQATRLAQTPATVPVPNAPAAAVPASFDTAVNSLLKREGGYVAKDGNSNAPANFGINQKFNPDVDVKGLTRERAIAIYKERYWNAIDGDNLPPATALVALDAAALQGPGVAKKLIADANGDPMAMIEIRRQQLKALAARDPTQAPNLAGWLKRMDGLQAEVAKMPAGGIMTVGAAVRQDMAPDTSGLPNSHDVRAQLPLVMARIDAKADERFGADDANPAKIAYKTRAYAQAQATIGREVAGLDAIQRQANDTVLAAVAGQKDAPPITDMAAIMADPVLATNYNRLLPAGKLGIQHIVAQQAQAALGRPAQVNARLEQSIFQRMLLPSDDQQAITRPEQLTPFASQGLTMESHSRLVAKLEAIKTPEGKAFQARADKLVAGAGQIMKAGPLNQAMFDANPQAFYAKRLEYQLALDAKIQEYRDAKKDPNLLLTPGKPEYFGDPKFIETFMKPPAQVLREAAIKVDPAAARLAVGRIGGVAQPAALPEAVNPKTGERLVLKDGKWQKP